MSTNPFIRGSNSRVIRDADWVSNSFMMARDNLDERYVNYSTISSADVKFADTRIGGNVAINNPPAYTRYADPRVVGLNRDNRYTSTIPRGMGRYYSEQLDDNAHRIYMRFGVPSYRGMLAFFTGMGNLEAALLARTGRVSPMFYIGRVVGIVVSIRFAPVVLIGAVIRMALNRGSSKYYSLKPTMTTYWNRVNFIANNFAVSMGLISKFEPMDSNTERDYKELDIEDVGSANDTKTLVAKAHRMAPEIFRARGGVDVYFMANRYQMLADAYRKIIEERIGKASSEEQIKQRIAALLSEQQLAGTAYQPKEFTTLRDEWHNSQMGNVDHTEVSGDAWANSTQSSLSKALAGELSGTAITADQANSATPAELNAQGQAQPIEATATYSDTTTAASDTPSMMDYYATENGTLVKKKGWLSKIVDMNKASFNEGYQFVAFNVEHTGPVSASFSNSTRESDISSKINGFSSQAASLRFSFSQGTTGIPGIDAITNGIKEFGAGVLSGLEIGGLVSLAGSSFVDIPEHWESSSATMPSETYNIKLRSPYGNKLSRFINLYVPLAMILAGALPISHGRQSFGSPFICELYSEGRNVVRLGIMDGVTVTHGTGNLGFNRANEPLAFDVSFTVKDLSRVMHAPIDTFGGLLSNLFMRGVFDDDSRFNDYVSTVTAVSLADMTSNTQRVLRNLALRAAQWESFWSTSHLSMAAWDTMPGRMIRNTAALGAAFGMTPLPSNQRTVAG